MKLKDLIERRGKIEVELRTIYDEAEKAGKDLTGEALEKWNTLKTELDDVKGKESRARVRDELDRKADARPVTETREGDAWGLTREQRMADFHKAATGDSCEGLSFGRFLHARLTGNWKDAQAEQRVMGSVPDTAGGYFLAEAVSANVIDLVRNVSVLNRAGALTVPVTAASMRLVRVLSDPTAAWRAEGQIITESDASFGALNVVPKSLGALVRINAELLGDAPNFASVIDAQLAAALALKLDSAGLYGSGASNEPLGLRNTVGVNEISMGANGAVPTDYDDFLDLMTAIEEDNGSPNTLIWAPRSKNTMSKIVTGITSDLTKLTPPADFAALTKLVSNQVSIAETQGSSNASSTAFMGGFQNTAVAMRQQIQIETSRQAGDDTFAKNQILIRAILRADIAVLRPSQLGRLIGINAS